VHADEVAALLHFLAADDCPVLSGLAIPIDGGMSCGMSIGLTEAVVASLSSGVAVLPHDV
jgi:hypothetical protein